MNETVPFGKITKTSVLPNGNKLIDESSYFYDKLKWSKKSYSVSVKVMDKSQALSEIMKALELITSKQTSCLNIKITANKDTYLFDKLVKTYTITAE